MTRFFLDLQGQTHLLHSTGIVDLLFCLSKSLLNAVLDEKYNEAVQLSSK